VSSQAGRTPMLSLILWFSALFSFSAVVAAAAEADIGE
jgi:hypothetical protein